MTEKVKSKKKRGVYQIRRKEIIELRRHYTKCMNDADTLECPSSDLDVEDPRIVVAMSSACLTLLDKLTHQLKMEVPLTN